MFKRTSSFAQIEVDWNQSRRLLNSLLLINLSPAFTTEYFVSYKREFFPSQIEKKV